MADDLNIDAYLVALRRHLRGRPDGDVFVDEAEDHLWATAERHLAAGTTRADAEARAVHAFGAADVVAEALASATGAAVPTADTRAAGTTAVVGAGAWLAVAALFWASHLMERGGSNWEGTPQLLFLAGAGMLAAGSATTLVLANGLRTRTGGSGVLATAPLAFLGLATAASMVAWAIPLWVGLLALGSAPVALATARHGAAPRIATLLFGVAWPTALVTIVVLHAAAFGSQDEWGDRPEAMLVGMTSGCVLAAASLGGLGGWLRHEELVEGRSPRPAEAG